MTKDPRTKRPWLALALSALPACLVLSLSWAAWEQNLERERHRRLDSLAAGLRTSLDERFAANAKKLAELAASEPVGRLLLEMARGTLDPRSWINEAGRWMSVRDLDVLCVFEPGGTILSSGQLPAKFGERDDCLYAAARGSAPSPSLCRVQLLRGSSIVEAWAVVSGLSRKWEQSEVLLAGGQVIEPKLGADWARMGEAVFRIQEGEAARTADEGRFVPLISAQAPAGKAALGILLGLERQARPPITYLWGLFAVGTLLSILWSFALYKWIAPFSVIITKGPARAAEPSGPSSF